MIYFFTNKKSIKIGYTSQPINKRLQQLNTGSDQKLWCIGYVNGNIDKEKELHKKFDSARIRHNGEWFSPSSELIDYINMYNEKPNVYIEYDSTTNTVEEYFCIKRC